MKKTITLVPSRCWRFAARFASSTVLAAALAAAPSLLAQTKHFAYWGPEGLNGNQNLASAPTIALGVDFDIVNEIVITRLGAFDDDSNGFNADTVMTVRIWDRAAVTEMASIQFTQASPGEAVGGLRFKPLDTPLRLPRGFKGVVTLEGFNEAEWGLNSHGDVNAVTWTLDSGNGSVAFVGSSRYGTGAPPAMPDVVDGGPVARYLAGSFEFETTTLMWPGKPDVAIATAGGAINLSWGAVTNPVPAAKYRVSRGTSPAGPFTQVAEVTSPAYSDAGLPAGVAYSYTVEAITADNHTGFPSDVKTAAVYTPAPDIHIAYYTPPSTPANQALQGNLGFDFDVQNPIIIRRLGVFDQDSDGIKGELTARIYNRETQEVLAELSFSAEDQGILIGSHRFKDLPSPLRLEGGFKGVIAAEGFGPLDQIWNSRNNPAAVRWTLDDGKGSLQFVGTSRLNSFLGNFPDAIQGGGVARWSAGSFEFQSLAAERPGTPVVTVVRPFQDKLVTLNWPAIVNPLPAAKYEIYRTGPDGTAQKIGEATDPTYRDTAVENGTSYCYTVRAVAAGGQTGEHSPSVCATPGPRIGGIAYIVPEGITGNQNVGGASLGMDFDVALPVRITRLGAFDSGGDGYVVTINVAIFNRDSVAQPVVTLQLTPEDPGELIGGSRFKDLPQPVVLPAGFKGSIVTWGYNVDEMMYNTHGTPNPELQTFEGGSLVFVGGSRYGAGGGFPATVDGGPVNRYATGTFAFEPEQAAQEIRLAIARNGANVRLTWEGGGTLQRSAALPGGWQNVDGAVSGVELPVNAAGASYFRVSR